MNMTSLAGDADPNVQVTQDDEFEDDEEQNESGMCGCWLLRVVVICYIFLR